MIPGGCPCKVSFDTSIDDIPKCPLTKWDSENIDFSSLTAPARAVPHKLAAAAANGDEEGYITANREAILAQLTESGAIWFQVLVVVVVVVAVTAASASSSAVVVVVMVGVVIVVGGGRREIVVVAVVVARIHLAAAILLRFKQSSPNCSG